MRLQTDFHDYYDTAIGYGIDDNVYYSRFTKEVEIHIKLKSDFPDHRNVGLLGFCGKIYPFIEVRRSNLKRDEYDFEDYEIVERYYAYSFEEYNRKIDEWEDYVATWYTDHSRETKLKQFFVNWNYESDEIFLEHKVPIWVVKLDRHQNKGVINPKLKDYRFYEIKDALVAFQEISTYLSNILIEQKEIVVIPDQFRIEQHGFDLKKSFRKEKTKTR